MAILLYFTISLHHHHDSKNSINATVDEIKKFNLTITVVDIHIKKMSIHHTSVCRRNDGHPLLVKYEHGSRNLCKQSMYFGVRAMAFLGL